MAPIIVPVNKAIIGGVFFIINIMTINGTININGVILKV